MNRIEKVNLLEQLKNGEITHANFLQEIKNDGKTVFRVVVKRNDGTYLVNGETYSEDQLKELQQKFPSSRVINITSKNNG